MGGWWEGGQGGRRRERLSSAPSCRSPSLRSRSVIILLFLFLLFLLLLLRLRKRHRFNPDPCSASSRQSCSQAPKTRLKKYFESLLPAATAALASRDIPSRSVQTTVFHAQLRNTTLSREDTEIAKRCVDQILHSVVLLNERHCRAALHSNMSDGRYLELWICVTPRPHRVRHDIISNLNSRLLFKYSPSAPILSERSTARLCALTHSDFSWCYLRRSDAFGTDLLDSIVAEDST